MIATKNFLLHGPESVTSTTKNECIDSEFSHLENIRSYFYEPSLQSTDCLALTVDRQVWQYYKPELDRSCLDRLA